MQFICDIIIINLLEEKIMIIAYNKNKERIHIDDALRNEKYYCPTCGEELTLKRGNIKVHHYSHKAYSNCDGWHYDMSDWHSSWQSQFPIENQEVVFELNGKKHRADVFINNTVIEFQHSKISKAEFDDRNAFYSNLGYKLIWIFDASSSYLNGNIENHGEGDFYWKNALVQIVNVDKTIDIYLQEFNNIWTSMPNYKEMSVGNDELTDYACLHHVDGFNRIGPQSIYSSGINNTYDYSFIDRYINVNFLHDGSFNLKMDMTKKDFTTNDLSDEILSEEDYAFGIDKYLWCPNIKKFVRAGDSCHACSHLSENYDRCKFRFETLLGKSFDKIIDINYSDDGKVNYVIILKDKKRYKIKYDPIPKAIFTLKEAFELYSNTQVIRAKNIKNGWKAQLTKYNYDMMKRYGKCFGKMQGPEIWNNMFSKVEHEIFNYDKKEWELTWRK